MKTKRFLILLLFINIIYISVDAFAQEGTGNEDYNKTLSLSTNPVVHILLGYNATVEFTGLGALGIYGSYLSVNQDSVLGKMAQDIDTELTGYQVNGGLRYYYDYPQKYHDSKYFAAEVQYASIKFEYTPDAYFTGSLDATITGFVLYHGWRWQWSLIFLDLNVGAGYMKVGTDVTGSFTEADKKDIEDATTGYYYGLNFAVGIAF